MSGPPGLSSQPPSSPAHRSSTSTAGKEAEQSFSHLEDLGNGKTVITSQRSTMEKKESVGLLPSSSSAGVLSGRTKPNTVQRKPFVPSSQPRPPAARSSFLGTAGLVKGLDVSQPIDLTLSDTDDEVAPEATKRNPLSSGSSGSIMALDSEMRPTIRKDIVKARPTVPKASQRGPTPSQASPSEFRRISNFFLVPKPSTPQPNAVSVSRKTPNNSLLNPHGISSQKPIDVLSSSSRSSSTPKTPAMKSALQRSLNDGGSGLTGPRKRVFSRTPSDSLSISNLSPHKKRKKMPPQPEKHRMSLADWEAAISVKKKLDDERRAMLNSSQGSNGKIGETELIRSVSNEPAKIADESRSFQQSPLKRTAPVPSTNSLAHTDSARPSRDASFSGGKIITPTKSPSSSSSIRASKASDNTKHAYNTFNVARSSQSSAQAGPSKVPTPSPVKSKHLPPSKTQAPSSQQVTPQHVVHARTSSRPRPAPGTYTIPSEDTPMDQWPRTNSTHLAGGSARRRTLTGISPSKVNLSGDKTLSHADLDKVKNINRTSSNLTSPVQPRTSLSPVKRLVAALPHNESPLKRIIGSSSQHSNTLRRSTSSGLTPLPSRAASPAIVSPVKSLSASPVKGRPFPRLLGDATPVSKNASGVTTAGLKQANEGDAAEVEEDVPTDPDKIFDEFEDFDWASDDGDPPSPQVLPPTQSNPLSTNEASNSMKEAAHVDETPKHVKQLSTPRLSENGELSHHERGAISTEKETSSLDKYDHLLEARRAEAEREKAEEREREKRMELALQAAIIENGEEKEIEVGQGANFAGFLDDLATEPIEHKTPSPTKSNMIFAVQSRSELNKAKKEADKAAKRKAKLDAIQKAFQDEKARKWKNDNKEFSKIMQGLQTGNEYEEILKDIRLIKNRDRKDGEDAYPTPDTDMDSPSKDASRSLNLDLDLDLDLGESDISSEYDEDDPDRLVHRRSSSQGPEDDLEDMIAGLQREGLGVDESLIRDARAAVQQKNVNESDLVWEGFWKDQEKLTATPNETKQSQPLFVSLQDLSSIDDPILKLLLDMIDPATATPDLGSFSVAISSGTLSFVEKGRKAIGMMLLQNAFRSSDPDWSNTARIAFNDLVQTDDYFHQADLSHFLDLGIHLLADFGGPKEILSQVITDSQSESESEFSKTTVLQPTIDRKTACGVVCRIIMALSKTVAEVFVGAHGQASTWISLLLLLCIDNTSSTALKRTIGDTVQALLQKAFNVSEHEHELSKDIARSIAETSSKYNDDVKVAILASLGQRSHECRMVNRWLGMEYLIPGSIGKIDIAHPRKKVYDAPPIPYLLDAIEELSNLIRPIPRRVQVGKENENEDSSNPDPAMQMKASEEPNYDQINHMVTFLYAAMSDMAGLVDQLNIDFAKVDNVKDLIETCEIGQVRDALRRIRDLISDLSNGTLKSVVKARLHQLYEISRLTLSLEIKKKLRTDRLGKHLKVGVKGQPKLNFDKREDGLVEKNAIATMAMTMKKKANININMDMDDIRSPNGNKNKNLKSTASTIVVDPPVSDAGVRKQVQGDIDLEQTDSAGEGEEGEEEEEQEDFDMLLG
ncbi:uncharacterized protein I303_107667 [Kwoniella dejecticola CBS 10117]|uniref:Uncharacterized protein n=1 Tax=Kwoniella dejecticola CBS 10117 TaxID=1296121 RepID=A0A1A5ZVD7_9TREE|nr:uncharacterized protein I303_07677 [Kwoniella dejecticola CBS 10117]OBR81767.1 hypothetical protein I303_07677 [Kwoniella dejecticola CBS 10117]